MNSIRRPKRLRQLSKLNVVSILLAVALASFLVFTTVQADGGWGPGGNGGGSCGSSPSFCSTNGTRWQSYTVTAGGGPNCGFKDDELHPKDPSNIYRYHVSPAGACTNIFTNSQESSTWDTVVSTCGVGGKVFVFELNDGKNDAMGYNYNTANGALSTGDTQDGQLAYDAWVAAGKAGLAGSAKGATWGPTGGNIGWFCYAKAAPPAPPTTYKITPSITISKSTAKPGDTVTWTHTAKNTGTASTGSTKINYGWTTSPSVPGTHLGATALAKGKSESSTSTYKIKASDVGKTICRYTYADPKATGNNAAIYSSKACVTVPYNYSLTPTITNLSPTSMQAAGGVTSSVVGNIKNSGATVSDTATWQYTSFVVGAAQPIPAIQGQSSDTNPCHLLAGYSGCITMPGSTGSGSRTFPANSTTGETTSEALGAYPLGSQICYVLSVAPPAHSSAKRSYSNVRCVVVAKLPLVQVSGGDLVVGRGGMGYVDPNPATINVNRFSTGGETYGSWSEFAATAPGASNIATGGALASQANRSAVAATDSLTFANNDSRGDGYFGSTGNATNLYAAYPTTPSGYAQTSVAASTTIDLGGLSGKHYITTSSSATLKLSGNITPGTTIIIHAAGPVEITGNITYAPGPYTSPTMLPQVLIASNMNVLIDPAVTDVDSWLYANGSASANGVVDTCYVGTLQANSSYTNGLSAAPGNPCNASPLAVNGPVGASHLQLRRTAGADGATDAKQSVSGESFNLRPDAFLWLAAQGSTGGPTTVYTQEVAPRY